MTTIKQPFWLRIAILLFCLTAAAGAFASLENAWDSLLKNEVETAKPQFQAVLDAGQSEEALRGLLFCAWTRGDSPETAKILARLVSEYPDSPYTAAYLSLWSGSELHGWPVSERARILEEAYKKSASSAHRQIVAYKWMETLDMRLDDGVEATARKAGVLVDGWNVLGPFGRLGTADFFAPFGPETGFRDSYSGWRSKVQFQPIERPDLTGLVEFGALIQPDTGVAYAVNALESKSDAEAWLTVYSPSAVQVWWNGKPVTEKAHYFLHTGKAHTVSVPVRKGKNLLTIKSQKVHSAWWVRAALQSQGNEPLDVVSIPFQWQDYASLFLLPFEAAASRAEESVAELSPYPFGFPDASSPGERTARQILLAAWYGDRGEYETARRYYLEAGQSASEFALPYSLYGDASLRLAEERTGSKSRFHQEAEVAFRKALQLDPACKSALIGLVTYFLDRDQTDQALDCLDQHLAQYPSVRDEDRSNLILYSYGILYSRKNFELDSARAYQDALDGWVPSYEVYRLLFDYYRRNNETGKAGELIARALREFPAFEPFLERAGRLETNPAVSEDALGFLHRALRIHPDRISYAFLLGDVLENRGQIDEAHDWYGTLVKRYPLHPRLLERQAALDYLNAGRDSALASYEKAFGAAPHRMAPFRALRDAGGQSDFPYQKYDVNLADIDPSEADRWKESRASAIYLLDIMVLDIHEDGSYDQYIHQAIKVMNQEGMRKWAEVVIPKGGQVEIVMAKTIAPDGTEWDVSNIQDLSGQQSLSMYGIEPGVILEYAYLERIGRNEPGANFCGGGYFFGSDDDPMLISKLTIVKPESIPLHLERNPHDFEPEVSRDNGWIVYEWEKRYSEGLKPERFAPPLGQRVPSLQWSTCPDWMPFAERQRMSIWGYEESMPAIDSMVKQIQEESQSKREFVEKAYDYVRTRIEETAGGFTTADTWVLGAGGKFQKMRLVRQMLKKAGIDVRMALSVDTEQEGGYHPMPVLNYPGSLILTVPRQEGISERILLDFSSRFAPMGSVDPISRKQAAFFFDTEAPYFEPLDPVLWERGLVDRQYRLTVRDDRSAAIEGQYAYDYLYDRQIREALTNPEVKQRLADSQLAGDLRGIQIEKSDLQDLEDIKKPPRLTFTGVIPDIVKPKGERTWTLSPVLVRSEAASIVAEPTRQFPMEFATSPQWNPLDIRLDLSGWIEKGAAIYLPEDMVLITEFGFYSLYYEWHNKEVIVRRSFLIPKQKIEPEAYSRFVNFCRIIDQSEDLDIMITLPSS